MSVDMDQRRCPLSDTPDPLPVVPPADPVEVAYLRLLLSYKRETGLQLVPDGIKATLLARANDLINAPINGEP